MLQALFTCDPNGNAKATNTTPPAKALILASSD